jgi:hypothetical protein
MAFKIDKHHPLPEDFRPSKPMAKYPLYKMVDGDSFFAPDKTEQKLKSSVAGIKRQWIADEIKTREQIAEDRWVYLECVEEYEGELVKGCRVWLNPPTTKKKINQTEADPEP